MLASKLTRKYQATIPAKVRQLLGLIHGDVIIFEVQEGQVAIRKAVPLDLDYTNALVGTLSEWHSENDEEAYGDL